MQAMLPTSDVMEIKGSRAKLAGLFVLGALMVALSAAEAFRWVPARGAIAWGWLGLLFFGFCTAIWFRRLLTADRAVVTITPDGIRDIRLSADFVPWSGIRDIKTASIRGKKFIVIAVDPSIERQLKLTAIARWTREPNRALGFDGLCVLAIGLKITHDVLFKACRAHWQASGGHHQARS